MQNGGATQRDTGSIPTLEMNDSHQTHHRHQRSGSNSTTSTMSYLLPPPTPAPTRPIPALPESPTCPGLVIPNARKSSSSAKPKQKSPPRAGSLSRRSTMRRSTRQGQGRSGAATSSAAAVPQSALEERERLAGDVRFSTVYGNHILVGTSAVNPQVVHVYRLGGGGGHGGQQQQQRQESVPPVPAIPAQHGVLARPRPSRTGPMLEVHSHGARDSYFSVHSTVNGPLPAYYPSSVDPLSSSSSSSSSSPLVSPSSPLYSPGMPSPLRQVMRQGDIVANVDADQASIYSPRGPTQAVAAPAAPRARPATTTTARRTHSVRSKKTRARMAMPGSTVSRSSSKSSTYSKRSAYSVASPKPGDLESLTCTPEMASEMDEFPPMPSNPPPPPPQRVPSITRPLLVTKGSVKGRKQRKAKPARIMLPQEILAMEARRQTRREEMSRLAVKQDTLMQAIAEAPLSNPGAVPGWGGMGMQSQMASINTQVQRNTGGTGSLAPGASAQGAATTSMVTRPNSISRKPVPRPSTTAAAAATQPAVQEVKEEEEEKEEKEEKVITIGPIPPPPSPRGLSRSLSRQPSIRASRITRRSTIVNAGGSRVRSSSKSSFTGIPSLRLDCAPLGVRYSQFQYKTPSGSPKTEFVETAFAGAERSKSRSRSNSAASRLGGQEKALPALPTFDNSPVEETPVRQNHSPGRGGQDKDQEESPSVYFPLGFDPAIVTYRSPIRRSISSHHRRSGSDSSTCSTDTSSGASSDATYLHIEPTTADLMRASYYEELRRRFDEDFAAYHIAAAGGEDEEEGEGEMGRMHTPPLDEDDDSASSTSGSPPMALPSPPPPLRIMKAPKQPPPPPQQQQVVQMPVELPANHPSAPEVFAIELDSRPVTQFAGKPEGIHHHHSQYQYQYHNHQQQQQQQPQLRYTASATMMRRPIPVPIATTTAARAKSTTVARTEDIVRQHLYDPDPNEITTVMKGAGDPFYSPTNYKMPSHPVVPPAAAPVPVTSRLPVAPAPPPQPAAPKKRELPLFTRTIRHTAASKPPPVPPVRETPFFLDVKTPGSSVVYTSSPPLPAASTGMPVDKRWESPSPAPAIPKRGATTTSSTTSSSATTTTRPRATSHSTRMPPYHPSSSSIPPPPVPPLPRIIPTSSAYGSSAAHPPPPIPHRDPQSHADTDILLLNRNSDPIVTPAEHVLSHYTPGTLITVQNPEQRTNPMHHVNVTPPTGRHWRSKSTSTSASVGQSPTPPPLGEKEMQREMQREREREREREKEREAAMARDRQTMKERLEKAFSRIGERGVVEIGHGHPQHQHQHQSYHHHAPTHHSHHPHHAQVHQSYHGHQHQHPSSYPPPPPMPPMPSREHQHQQQQQHQQHQPLKGHASKGSLGSSWKKFHSGVFGS